MYSLSDIQDLQSCTRGYFHTTDGQALLEFAEEEKLRLSFKWEICPVCRGEGTQALHGLVLGPEEISDPDFMEDYRRGVYDTQCEECREHPGRVRVPDMAEWSDDVKQRWRRYLRDVHALNAESLMEKRMGC